MELPPPSSPSPPSPTASSTGGKEVRRVVVAACLGWLFSAMDTVLLMVLREEVGRTLETSAHGIDLAIGIGLLGSAVGGPLFAHLGDGIGRRAALARAVLLYSIATGLTALVRDAPSLVAVRFLAGMGTGGEWALGMALVTEVLEPSRRGVVGGLVASMYNVGTFLAVGLMATGLPWRAIFGLATAPALLVFWFRRRVPESGVWLDLDAARRAGNLPPDLVRAVQTVPTMAILRGRLRRVTLVAVGLFSLMNLGFFGFASQFMAYLQREAAAGGLGLDRQATLPYMAFLNVSALVAILLGGSLSDRMGRRAAFSAFCATGVAGFLALYLAASRAALGPPGGGARLGGVPLGVVVAFGVICFAYGMNGVVGPMLAELYPTHVRATGPGLTSNLGKGLGGLPAPPLFGFLVVSFGFPLGLALPGLAFLAAGLLVWALPPAAGRILRGVEDDRYLRPGR